MTKYIAILRGINVGGRRKLLMADLKVLCSELNLFNVTTYIQSGNVLFKSTETANEIENKLKQAIAQKFDYDVPTIVITIKELIQIRNLNPYLANADVSQLYYTFLKSKPDAEAIENINTIKIDLDSFTIENRTAYINCLKGYSSTKLTNDFFEKKLKITTTTRNAKTVNKLIELAS